MAIPERTARTKTGPSTPIPSEAMSFVGCQNEQKKKEEKKGELIQPGTKIDERRQLVQREEVQKRGKKKK